MASDTEVPAAIDGQLLRIFRMIECRPMTIFTRNHPVWGRRDGGDLVVVALVAIIRGFKFIGEIFPFLLIARSMETVHVSPLLYSEVIGDNEQPCQENYCNNTDHHVEWSPNMFFHRNAPFVK